MPLGLLSSIGITPFFPRRDSHRLPGGIAPGLITAYQRHGGLSRANASRCIAFPCVSGVGPWGARRVIPAPLAWAARPRCSVGSRLTVTTPLPPPLARMLPPEAHRRLPRRSGSGSYLRGTRGGVRSIARPEGRRSPGRGRTARRRPGGPVVHPCCRMSRPCAIRERRSARGGRPTFRTPDNRGGAPSCDRRTPLRAIRAAGGSEGRPAGFRAVRWRSGA